MNTRRIAVVFACFLLAAFDAVPQEGNGPLQQAIDRFYAGEWEQATRALRDLLEQGHLSRSEAAQARKFIGIGYILLGQEEQAVEVFKELVRENPDFQMQDLAIEGDEPPAQAVRYFGQALLEVRQEELKAWEARLSKEWRRGALLRSAFLPGWGQGYKGYRIRGYVLAGLALSSAGYAVWADLSYRNARDAYEKAPEGSDFESLYDDYQKKADRADLALGAVGVVWGLNLIDAAIQGPNITRSPVSLRISASDGGVVCACVGSFY